MAKRARIWPPGDMVPRGMARDFGSEEGLGVAAFDGGEVLVDEGNKICHFRFPSSCGQAGRLVLPISLALAGEGLTVSC